MKMTGHQLVNSKQEQIFSVRSSSDIQLGKVRFVKMRHSDYWKAYEIRREGMDKFIDEVLLPSAGTAVRLLCTLQDRPYQQEEDK